MVFKNLMPSSMEAISMLQHARLDAASEIDRKTAVYATYWGMFQIGGANWKLCGTESYEGFVEAHAARARPA